MYKDEEVIQIAVNELKEIIETLGFEAELSASMSEGENDRKYVNIDISGEDLSLLIGFRGNTLRALENIVGLILNKQLKENKEHEGVPVRVVIDINSYKSKKDEQTRNIAIKAIDQVRESGQAIELPIMNPAERRIIHMVVKEEGMDSESMGEEGERYVIIKPQS